MRGCDCSYGGLGALLPPIHLFAPFSLGVELSELAGPRAIDTEAIRQALSASDYVLPAVQVYQKAGFFNPYIVVEGYSGREYGSATHLRDAVLSVIEAATRGAATINYGSVGFEAETYDPLSGATQTARYDASTGSATQAGPGQTQSIASWISRSLGISGTEASAVLIGGGALLLVLLLKR